MRASPQTAGNPILRGERHLKRQTHDRLFQSPAESECRLFPLRPGKFSRILRNDIGE